MDLSVSALVRSPETSADLSRVCDGLNGTRLQISVGGISDIGAAIASDPDITIIDVDVRDENELGRMGRLLNRHLAGRPVVATAADVTLQDVQKLIRLGFSDFLPQPFSRGDVEAAFEHIVRSLARAESARESGKVVSFLKAAGGVGSTTLLTQLGCIMARESEDTESRVCLLDFDIQFGTAALSLDLMAGVEYGDLVSEPERVDGELLRGLMGHHTSGLDVLGVPNEVMPMETVTPEFVSQCFKVARQEYDLTLVDLPFAWTGSIYTALQGSDLVLVVTNLSVGGIRRCRRQLDTLQAHGLPRERVKLVLNRYDKGGGNTVRAREAEQALGQGFDYLVLDDPKLVNEATNQGVMVSDIKRKSRVEQTMYRMIERMREDLDNIEAEEE